MLNISNSRKNLLIITSKRHNKLTKRQSSTIITTPIPTHDQISRLILDQKTPKEALHTFRWASNLPHFTHTQSTYNSLIHRLCTFRRFDTVHQLLEEMPASLGSPPDDDIFVTIVRGLGRAKMVREVVKVLDLVARFRGSASLKIYNAVLDVLVKVDIDIARGFYRRKMMASGVNGDMFTFGILMKGLCLTNRVADGFKLLQVMRSKGVAPNVIIYNTLVHALCKNGKLGVGRARSLVSEMSVGPNDVTFNILITAYCKEENVVQALVMLEKCFDLGFVPDVVVVTKVMEILCRKDRAIEAVEVLERWEKKGGKIDVVAYNTLVKGFCNLKKPKAARRFLKEMELKGCLPNADTYNALISGFCDSGLLDSALDMFYEMKMVGITWNFVTYDTLIRGLCSGGRIEDGHKIMELMEESKSGSSGHISPYNSIINGLYKTNRIDEALEFLTTMAIKFPRAVDRSRQILAFFNEGKIENAKKIYYQMIQEGSTPSILVYIILIRGLCEENMLTEALKITDKMLSCGYVLDVSTLNTLINALCAEGKVGRALKFLKDMTGRGCLTDSGSYSTLICEFCKRGDLHRGLMLLMEMVEKGNIPNYVSWNSLLQCLARESTWSENQNMCYFDDLLECILET